MPGTRRVLFVGRTIAHFSYYESIVGALLSRGAHVNYVVDEQWSASWAGGDTSLAEFKAEFPDLSTGWAPRRAGWLRDVIFPLREIRTYRSYITREETTPFYVDRWSGYLPESWREMVARPVVRRALKSSAVGLMLNSAEWLAPADEGVTRFIEQMDPDVVVATPVNMRLSEEVEHLKAARALGVPTAVPVLSWDNLSTKGLFHVTPDELYVWNSFQLDDALKIQKIPRERVFVTGSPFFDKWFEPPRDTPSRPEFCAQLGFSPDKPILLYLGSSRNIAVDESWFVEAVVEALRGATDARVKETQILVRPHPANAKIYKRLALPGVRVWPADGALPETRQAFADMRNSFLHSDASLAINTSGMIDSVLADLPTFTVKIERYAATQGDSVHFRHLLDAHALDMAADLPTFVASFGRVLSADDPSQDERRAFATSFARPQGAGRAAGDVIAERILALAARRHG